MSFYGSYFCFDGVPCTEYGLMMYNIDYSSSNGTNVLATKGSIIEDRIARRYSPIHYGVVNNTPLEFEMTFGLDINAIDRDYHLDRWDLDAISRWLTAHETYKWLEITQPDMEVFRYRCFITDLKYIDNGGLPWSFSCTVLCDSPYAYYSTETFSYKVNGNTNVSIYNKSSCPKFFKPIIDIYPSEGGTIQITNEQDGNSSMILSNIPTSVNHIFIDCENEIIENDTSINLYENFNFYFLRMARGVNKLNISGNCSIEFNCDFPVSIGG